MNGDYSGEAIRRPHPSPTPLPKPSPSPNSTAPHPSSGKMPPKPTFAKRLRKPMSFTSRHTATSFPTIPSPPAFSSPFPKETRRSYPPRTTERCRRGNSVASNSKPNSFVFSACETGRGKVVKSEGIEGFTRVLEYAGAKSTVTSLWKVQDESTATLMERFHFHLRQGERKDDALMFAMREVSGSQQNTGWRNPHEWAGFLLLGDPRNNGLGKAKSKSGK